VADDKLTTSIAICEHYNVNCALGHWLRYKTTVREDMISYNHKNGTVNVTGRTLSPMFLQHARYMCELGCKWKFNTKQLALSHRMR
jgi:hypothetical protein